MLESAYARLQVQSHGPRGLRTPQIAGMLRAIGQYSSSRAPAAVCWFRHHRWVPLIRNLVLKTATVPVLSLWVVSALDVFQCCFFRGAVGNLWHGSRRVGFRSPHPVLCVWWTLVVWTTPDDVTPSPTLLAATGDLMEDLIAAFTPLFTESSCLPPPWQRSCNTPYL
jgi:hypothetical protein